MRCAKARWQIDQHPGCLGGQALPQDLARHIESCPDCARHARRAVAALRLLSSDAAEVEFEAQIGDEFDRRLHSALVLESTSRAQEPLSAFAAMLSARLAPGCIWSRLARGTAVVVLAAAMLWSSFALLAPPAPPPPVLEFDHLAAFTVRREGDGRVFAAVTQHQSTRPLHPEEVSTR